MPSAMSSNCWPSVDEATNSWFHCVDLAEVGEAALGERPQEVERGDRLLVRRHQAVRVGYPGRLLGEVVVDHVAAEGVQDLLADHLGGGAAGLGELPGDPTQLDHRHPGAVGQDHGHLQDDLELVPDGIGAELGERLGAVPGLQDEGPALGGLAEGPGQVAGLAGEDQGREPEQLGVDALELVLVGPHRLLGGRSGPPRIGRPRVVGESSWHATSVKPPDLGSGHAPVSIRSPAVQGRDRAPPGAPPPARSRTSGTPPCSSPTTSRTSSAPWWP